jgi:hypothetical protein
MSGSQLPDEDKKCLAQLQGDDVGVKANPLEPLLQRS